MQRRNPTEERGKTALLPTIYRSTTQESNEREERNEKKKNISNEKKNSVRKCSTIILSGLLNLYLYQVQVEQFQ
jgi:hypothetical protein